MLQHKEKVEATFGIIAFLEELGHKDKETQAGICGGAMIKALSCLSEDEAFDHFANITVTMAHALTKYYKKEKV
jgi:hypothetical protein